MACEKCQEGAFCVSHFRSLPHTEVIAKFEGFCKVCSSKIKEGEVIIGGHANISNTWDCKTRCGAPSEYVQGAEGGATIRSPCNHTNELHWVHYACDDSEESDSDLDDEEEDDPRKPNLTWGQLAKVNKGLVPTCLIVQVLRSYLTKLPSKRGLMLWDGKNKLNAFLYLKKGQSKLDVPPKMSVIRIEKGKIRQARNAGRNWIMEIESYFLEFKAPSAPSGKYKRVMEDASRYFSFIRTK